MTTAEDPTVRSATCSDTFATSAVALRAIHVKFASSLLLGIPLSSTTNLFTMIVLNNGTVFIITYTVFMFSDAKSKKFLYFLDLTLKMGIPNKLVVINY